MKQRGRQSSAALEILTSTTLDRVPRQKPPHDLTDEECEIWSTVVNSEPADWFTPATVPLLAQYCRHCVRARHVAELIDRATGGKKLSLEDYDRLLKMQERESRAMTTLATKMRITQQSITNHRGNKKHAATARPWEQEEIEG